jgi:arsenite methyltransferase
MKTATLEQDEVRTVVRERYGKIASSNSGCGCGPTCCSPEISALQNAEHDPKAISQDLGYSTADMETVPEGANLGLGCGNPQAIAALKPGETVLDLGSGAGFDAFLAARAVGPKGFVIGVDMTPEMVSKARKNQATGGYANVEFRIGEIESLPVANDSVDVIISNCVINLSPDKSRVFRESFRVLKPGGRLAISDVVALAEIPAELRKDWELYTGCVAGASTIAEIKSWLAAAGFTQIRVEPKDGSRKIIGQWFPGQRVEEFVTSATIEAVKPARN